MGLDLYHSVPVKIDDALNTRSSKQNLSEFPEMCKEKLKDFIFYEDVTYIDWEATFQAVMQMSCDEFYEQFELFMERDDGVFFFCTKDCENPWEDPNKFTINDSQCKFLVQSDPHIFVKSLGGMRGGMKQSFYSLFKPNEVICSVDRVKEMSKHTDSPENFEMFIENFINNWTKFSFVEVSY